LSNLEHNSQPVNHPI